MHLCPSSSFPLHCWQLPVAGYYTLKYSSFSQFLWRFLMEDIRGSSSPFTEVEEINLDSEISRSRDGSGSSSNGLFVWSHFSYCFGLWIFGSECLDLALRVFLLLLWVDWKKTRSVCVFFFVWKLKWFLFIYYLCNFNWSYPILFYSYTELANYCKVPTVNFL